MDFNLILKFLFVLFVINISNLLSHNITFTNLTNDYVLGIIYNKREITYLEQNEEKTLNINDEDGLQLTFNGKEIDRSTKTIKASLICALPTIMKDDHNSKRLISLQIKQIPVSMSPDLTISTLTYFYDDGSNRVQHLE